MPRSAIHPGEHLADELRELGLSAAALARQIDVPVNRITAIINGQRAINFSVFKQQDANIVNTGDAVKQAAEAHAAAIAPKPAPMIAPGFGGPKLPPKPGQSALGPKPPAAPKPAAKPPKKRWALV